MNVKTLLLNKSKVLANHGIENSRFEAEFLLSFVLYKPREFLLAHEEFEVLENEVVKFEKLIERRAIQEPISQIVGNKEFFGLNFIVTKDTLTPRPETEMMVEEGISIIKEHCASPLLVLDIGTGSGCIAISVANKLEKEKVQLDKTSFSASDISKEALAICKKNIAKHELEGKITLLEGNLLSPALERKMLEGKKTFLVLANLPYLSEKIYSKTPVTVKNFEPKTSLYSDEEGLWHYKKLLEELLEIKNENPFMKIFALFEISPEQSESVSKLVSKFFPKQKVKFKLQKDLSGRWRMAKLVILPNNFQRKLLGVIIAFERLGQFCRQNKKKY